MKIEDFWKDRIAYYISFLTTDEGKDLMIFLSSKINEKEEKIEEIINANFNSFREVLTIDEWGGRLLLEI